MKNKFNIESLNENNTINNNKSTGKFIEPTERFLKDNRISLDITYLINASRGKPFIGESELESIRPKIEKGFELLLRGEGDCLDKGIPMTGWLSLPDEIKEPHLQEIQNSADNLAERIDSFVSLGIGGSYLGIEATFKAMTHTFYNQLARRKRNDRPEMYFLGQNTDPDFFRDTLDLLHGKTIGINVISKSGTTAETAIAFRIIRNLLEQVPGLDPADFIVATTDRSKGALRKLAEDNGYRTYIVPDNIGGRFSVLSDVGLFGLAVAGIDIFEFAAGFLHMKKRIINSGFDSNPAMIHAAVRHLAYIKGKKIEVVATNSTALYQLVRWMEQLFPESEGHHGYGIWVSPSMYSEKLHANGQMVQQGERNILETFIKLTNSDNTIAIPNDHDNLDGLNYLPVNGKTMNDVNRMVIEGPAYAHFKGEVPSMTIEIPRRNAFNIGQFYYLMEFSVALSGYLAGHNPFIQPGVEDYKKAMFALLGKPGTEAEYAKITAAINSMKRRLI